MQKDYEKYYHKLEKYDWWFLGRQDLIKKLVMKYSSEGEFILDLGCSGGKAIEKLKQRKVYGLDISFDAVLKARKAGLKNIINGDAQNIPIKDGTFDLVVCSDLLEHIKKDKQTVNEIHRVLKKGGIALIFVPAFKFLWGQHDIVNQHLRRYSKRGFVKLLGKKFIIRRLFFWNFFLFFPLFLFKFVRRFKPGNPVSDQFLKVPKLINSFFLSILGIENKLVGRGINFPFGVSLIAVLEKR